MGNIEPQQIPALVSQVLLRWQPDLRAQRIEPLTPDASLRRYFRAHYGPKDEPGSVVVMVFDSVKAAEVGEGRVVNSDVAYVQLSHFFVSRGIAVPLLLFHESGFPALVIEDLGDEMLGELLQNRGDVDALYRAAVDELGQLQEIAPVSDVICFEREFSYGLYVREMEEFRDFYLSSQHASECNEFFSILAREIDALPKVLTHRDYHSWNLMRDATGRLRIIDFQDALLAPAVYDIAALLHDRDTDQLLGSDRREKLLRQFRDLKKFSAEQFEFDLTRVLLQRDLKVVGRFAKLVKERGLVHYGKWIPGTYRRVCRSLEQLAGMTQAPWYAEFLRLCQSFPSQSDPAERDSAGKK